MKTKESKKIVTEMQAYAKKVTASKSKARSFLVNTGTHTPKGHLRKGYL